MPEDYPPATPYLFVPQADYDTGEVRPVTCNDAWVWSPAIFLLGRDGNIEDTPRVGADYRLLVLVGNSGAAPAQNAFAQFRLDNAPYRVGEPNDGAYVERRPTAPTQDGLSLGSSAFTVPQSSRGDLLSWALSPQSWQYGSGPAGDCAYIRVFDQFADRFDGQENSSINRKDAARLLYPDLTGIWEGTEIDTVAGTVAGTLRIAIQCDWKQNSLGDVIPLPTFELSFNQLPQIPNRHGSIGMSIYFQNKLFFTLNSDIGIPSLPNWKASIQQHSDDSLEINMTDLLNVKRMSARLKRIATIGKQPPSPNLDLLKRVRVQISSQGTASRKQDASLVFAAISRIFPS